MKDIKELFEQSLCTNCNGDGFTSKTTQTIIGNITINRNCTHCQGNDNIIFNDIDLSVSATIPFTLGNADEFKNCLMVLFNIEEWSSILSVIDTDDLHEKGLEDEQHVTILYGLHKTVQFDELKPILKPTYAEISDVGIFENEEFDVLKFNIHSPHMDIMNAKAKKFPWYNQFPDYNPHMTIAYLKRGMGKKYLDLFNDFIGVHMVSSQFKYTVNINGEKKYKFYTIQE